MTQYLECRINPQVLSSLSPHNHSVELTDTGRLMAPEIHWQNVNLWPDTSSPSVGSKAWTHFSDELTIPSALEAWP